VPEEETGNQAQPGDDAGLEGPLRSPAIKPSRVTMRAWKAR
jgi:hypothetical protein